MSVSRSNFCKKASWIWDTGREFSSASTSTASDCELSDSNQLNKWNCIDISKEKGERRQRSIIQADTLKKKADLAKYWIDCFTKSGSPAKGKVKPKPKDKRNFQRALHVESLRSDNKIILNDLPSNANATVSEKTLKTHFKSRLLSERVKSKEALNKLSPNKMSITSSKKTEPIRNLSNEEFQNKGKKTESKPTLVKKVSSANCFLPVRSDQQKLSSKMFLGSLMPPGEKERTDLHKWKLKQSKKKWLI